MQPAAALRGALAVCVLLGVARHAAAYPAYWYDSSHSGMVPGVQQTSSCTAHPHEMPAAQATKLFADSPHGDTQKKFLQDG